MSQFDEQAIDLQRSIFRSKIAKAKRATMAQNLADGPKLFDQSMRLMRDAIRPHVDQDEETARVVFDALNHARKHDIGTQQRVAAAVVAVEELVREVARASAEPVRLAREQLYQCGELRAAWARRRGT